MQVVYARCAGLDVHKKTESACVSVCEPEAAKRQQTRVFGTFTCDLLALTDWLKQQDSPSRTYAKQARRAFQPLAFLRGHSEKRNGSLINVLAIALRTADVAFVVLTEGENQFK